MAREPLAIYPKTGPLGVMSLVRNGMSLASLAVQPRTHIKEYLPRGNGETVLVIPAFLSGDWSTLGLRRFLARLGYRVETAGIPLNIGPTTRLIARLDSIVEHLAADGSIVIIGQSLGGVLARDLARRHRARVAHIITLCSPLRVPITTPLAPAAQLLAPLYDRDWLARRHAIAGPLGVPVTALYSEEDGVVAWRECLQGEHAGCQNIRVEGAHATIASTPSALRAIARALAARGE